MSFEVYELPRAKADVRGIFQWLFESSPSGAKAWLNAYDDALEQLSSLASVFGPALEAKDCIEFEVKQVFFKTKRGRVYRVLYFIEGNDVYVLRVRGPGQAAVDPEEIK